jgi:hypothetical protein
MFRDILTLRPGMKIMKVSAKTGEGLAEYLQFFERRRARLSQQPRSD